jgi:predicted amidohydrolase
MKEFIAACVQIALIPNDVQANVEKGVAWLERAVNEYEADLVAFPETVTTGYETDLDAEELWDRTWLCTIAVMGGEFRSRLGGRTPLTF